MRIGVIGSMQYTERMILARDDLIRLGHTSYVTSLASPFIGKTTDEIEQIKLYQKNNLDAIREFWRLMQGGDAVLVLNLTKDGIENYIGGNTFLEIGFAHVLNQKIFLYNPIPKIPIYQSEIEAMNPTIIYQDLTKINENDHSTISSKKIPITLESLVKGAMNVPPNHEIIILPSDQCSLLTDALDKISIPYRLMPKDNFFHDHKYYIFDLKQINII